VEDLEKKGTILLYTKSERKTIESNEKVVQQETKRKMIRKEENLKEKGKEIEIKDTEGKSELFSTNQRKAPVNRHLKETKALLETEVENSRT
jgi:hypothetical protein